MKKIIVLAAAILMMSALWAQSPEKMSYQSVIRDASDALVTNQTVGIQLSILQGSVGGPAVYVETQSPSTNINGLVSIELGSGTVASGNFTTIDWSAGPYFIKTETDPLGGTTYTMTGTSQLMSVPYALYAKTSGNGQGPAGATGAQGIQGITGNDGADGADGLDGAIGAQGIQGITGNDGAVGIDGAAGAPGIQGVTGTDGADGLDGAIGAQGIQGITGNDGTIGVQGIQGITGNEGTDGATGATGPAGAQGIQGVTGNDGADGLDGAIGVQGIQGVTGTDGLDGAIGAQGIQGITGNDGLDGSTGSQGSIGLTGADGIQGIQGPAGNDGQGGVTQAGTNVTITGTGTSLDPYIVNSTEIFELPTSGNAGDMNYWNGTAWVTIPAAFNEGATLQMISGVPTWTGGTPPAIGDLVAGGIVFWVDGLGGGLVAATTDQATVVQYGCHGTVTGADGFDLGTGNQNTIDINAGCTTPGTAADVCANLTLGGYSDWFLPSVGEMALMYNNIGQGNVLGLGNVGGFGNEVYWNSTEYSLYYGGMWHFGNGNFFGFWKESNGFLRAVRAF